MRIFANSYLILFFLSGLLTTPVCSFAQLAGKYQTISAISCDSLIKANVQNPDFIILDVRTPATWQDDHLWGSINRNYYDADFYARLSALPKNKIILLHCQSGGRSAPTLSMMKALNFSEVYEMKGGINAWKSSLLPTTSMLSPKLLLATNGELKYRTLQYGVADTLEISITNRANEILKFTSATFSEASEFTCNIDLKRTLTGAEDYTFSVYYKPLQISKDSVQLSLKSNGGDLTLNFIIKNTTVQLDRQLSSFEPKIYPNPANQSIHFENTDSSVQEVSLINSNGQFVKKKFTFQGSNEIDVSDLPAGIYFVHMVSGEKKSVQKLILN